MTFLVRIHGSGTSFDVGADETVLAAAQRQGVSLPHDCTLGGCGTCRVKLLQGQVHYDEMPFGITEEEVAEGYALACQARPQCDLELSVPAGVPRQTETLDCTARVSELSRLSPGIYRLRLALPEQHASLLYQPGQHLAILLEDGQPRNFSMAGAQARDGSVEVHIRQIPGGRFTTDRLPGLRPGDVVDLRLPLGSFHYRARDERPMLLMATGTGIAPLRGILESLLDSDDCPPVSLYWGMREAGELYLDGELRSWVDRLYEFRYVPVLSNPDPSWQGRRGYVQHAACEDHADLSEHAIYLCGSPAMIAQAKSALLQRGADPDYIYVDGFTFQQQL